MQRPQADERHQIDPRGAYVERRAPAGQRARTAATWRSAPWVLACTLLALTGCTDRSSLPPTGPPQMKWFKAAVLDRMTVERGETEAIVESVSATRGSWIIKRGSGGFERDLPDGGAYTLTTLLRGKGVRSFQVPVPNHFAATQTRIRVYVEGDGDCSLLATWIGSETHTLPEVAVTERDQFVDVLIPLPPVQAPEMMVLEFLGSAPVVGSNGITFERLRGGGTNLAAALIGPDVDRRHGTELKPGCTIIDPVGIRGDEGPAESELQLVASGRSAAGAGKGKLELALRTKDGVEVASTTVSCDNERWTQGVLAFPRQKEPLTVVIRAADQGPNLLVSDVQVVTKSRNPPTIVLITSDTHRGDHLGRFGSGGLVRTPILDKMADKGVFFTNCFSSTNVTNPSHIALMTGTHLRDTRIANNVTAVSESATTLAEILQAAGYRTFAATSVMHLTRELSGLGQGFDRFDSPRFGKRDGKYAIAQLLDWMKEAEGQPVFAWLHVYDAHAPYDPPDELIQAHYPSSKDPRDPNKRIDGPEAAIGPWIKERGYTDPEYVTARYRAAIDYVDVGMKRFLSLGRMQNAIFAFTSDHGESLDGVDNVFWEHGRLNVATMHVPLILSWPGATPMTTSAPVQQIDVGKTLLDLAGVEAPFPGVSLRGALGESPPNEPRFGIAGHGWSAAIELNGWFLTLQIKPYPRPVAKRDWDAGEVELFNLRVDPEGLDNLVDAEFPRAKKMRAALITWLEQADPKGLGVSVEVSEEAQASLNELGYGGGTEGAAVGTWWTAPANAPWVERFERRN
ncbi:MAG: sulfatase [Planctomycetota bacterium]